MYFNSVQVLTYYYLYNDVISGSLEFARNFTKIEEIKTFLNENLLKKKDEIRKALFFKAFTNLSCIIVILDLWSYFYGFLKTAPESDIIHIRNIL